MFPNDWPRLPDFLVKDYKTMTSYRKAIRLFSLVLSLGLPIAASAATFDVKTLIDTDNRRSTGCSVVTPGGIVNGIDVIVTTQGTVTGATGTVTAVTRQTCTNAVLNQFSSPTAVDGGWNVGVSPIGDVTVESHMGLDVLTWDNIGTPRFVFMSTSGLSSDVLLTPWSWGGGDIIMPHAARDRAMTPVAQRNILLDGASSDWAGSVPLANGTAASPVWRFISASAYAGMHDLFFNFKIHTNPAAPTAHDDNYALNTLGGTLTVATLGVLNNDNPNNQPITASLVDTTQHGTLSLAPDGGFTYVHDGSLASQDQFHYVAVGTSLSSNLATVTIDLPGTHPYTFTSPDNTIFTAGQPNTFLVVVTGKPTPALTVDGALPSGVTFVDNGNGTGTLSGAPDANAVGTYTFVICAEKNKPHQSCQQFTLTVSCPGVSAPITPTPAQVCANSTGNTASGPAGMATYTWAIANGTITSATNIQTITYTAGASGVVGLTLTVANASGCAATNTANVTINPKPATPAISPSPAQVCANTTGNTASGPAGAASYAWSIVNGTITSATNIQTITFTAGASGTVGLTLTVTNASACSATNSVNVPINANPSAPTITPTPATVCGNSTGNSASGPAGAASYAWSITNGAITSATNTQTITYTAGASGTVGLTLTVTNASGCSASNNSSVTINANPAAPAITPTPAQVCGNSTGNAASGPAGATSYAWSITNGAITSATNVQTITYTAGASGVVGLTLTVTNASGCSATNTVNVTVNPSPSTPTITPTPAQVCANSTGNTADGPAGATSYAWSIVNGTITSATNIQTITYTAGASGTVDLTLVVTNGSGCPASNTVNVTINANPATPAISPSPASVCANSTGNTASGPAGATTYFWSIVNGTITSATNIQTITYTAGASGTVDLTLTVTNAAGCSATSNTANVTINPNPAAPTITPTPAQVCANSTGNSASGPAGATTYSWSIVNGTITSAANIQTITYTAGASGTTDLTLTVTNASGCSASNTTNVTINASPATPTITPAPAQVCANSTGNSASGPAGATSYAWSIVNGTITSATNIQTITYTAGASGTVDLTLVVSNPSGCTTSNTVNVTINANPTTPAITPSPAQVCANSTGNTASGPAGATSYAWSITNGTITSATNIQTITYTAGPSGTVGLTLVVTNAAGCSASNSSNVTINANPTTPTITPTPAQVCANSTGNSASGPAGATSYAWSIVNGTITSATNIQTITYTAGATGTVDLTLVVTNAAGCSASNTANVTINANPATPTITPTPAQVCANSTGNTASGPAGATSYAWSIVNGTITSATNIQTITYTAGATGTVDLTLVVTNAAGCSASNTVNVTINANPATPAITPTPASVCANSTGNSASGPAGATSYAWSIVNGTITSAANIQTITYTAGASGTTDLTLVVTNPAGCSASNTVNVTINANPTTPAISPSPAQVCANSTGNTASGPAGATSYAWSIVNGTITSANNIQTITYTAGPSGTVDLTLVVSNGAGCSASNTVNVTINANPATPAITPTPAQVCSNSTGNSASGPAGATTYFWSIVNGTITSATNIQTITYTAGASGTVGLTLVVTNAAGCSASNSTNVTINANPTTPSITTPASTCANSTGNSASGPAGATTYFWSIVNGTITSATNIQTITYTAGASGTVGLTLVVTNAAGCSASNSTNVTINANPAVPTITPTPATLCPGSTGNSAAGPAGATTYFWSITNGTITSATNIQTITYTAGASGNVGLTLVVTNAAGCSASNTLNVAISNTAPAVTTQPLTQSVQAGNSVTFTAAASGTPAPTVQWEVSTDGGNVWNPIGGATTTSLSFTAQLSQSGNQYRAVFTNTCGTATSNAATLTVTCPTITVSRNGGGSFPNGIFNTAYTGQSVVASPTGGGEVYTFAVTLGSLPTGLSLSSSGAISGTPTATGVFNFTVTATNTNTAINCTGSQAFSISIAPSAVGDSYPAASHLVDNTQFVITGGTTTSPATPFVSSATNILTNDLPSGSVTATPGTFATSGGGSVTIAADGTFIYTPKANPAAAAVTSDSFTYTVVSNGVTSAAATVNLTLANRVWYVKNNGGGTSGQSQSPFTTLAAAQAASLAGDIIFVYNGDGLTTGQSLGITLKNNQQLIGEGVALVVNTVTLKAAGTSPQITNTTATSDVVTLADGDTVSGLTITGATRDGIAGNTHAAFTANALTIQTSTNSGLHLTSMTGAVTVTNTTFSGANGVGLDVNNGTATITLDATNSITANAGKRSVAIQNRPASAGLITIGAPITDNGLGMLVNNNASGTIAFTGAQTLATTTNPGVTLTTNTGTTINFSGTLNITTSTGSAFNATGGGTLSVTGTANVTTGAVAGSGVNINGVTVGASGVTFNSVNTTGATTGVSLASLGNGNVTINGGTISGGTTGLSLNTLGTSTVTLAGVTLTGATTAISGTTFGTLSIGASVNVSGVTALNLATGAVSGTFANVTSSGGTNGANLSAVTGTWGVTAGTLTGATGSTFNATGTSTGTLTWGGVINQANGANAVTISGSHTGTINFTGNVTTSLTSSGINISASSGTYSFTGGASTLAGSGGAVTIFNESGSISFGSGYAITNASPAFKIGGTATNTTANITYSGTMAPLAAGGVLLDINSTAGTYSTGTITFNGTTLGGTVGNPTGVISVIKSMTGTFVANNLNLTANNNSFANTLLAISGTNTGGSFTFNHLVLSANGTGHTGNGLIMSGGGTLTITATGGNSSIDAGGVALDLNGVALGASAIQTLNSTGGVNGVKLTSVTGGALTISGGAISGNSGTAFLMSGGSPTVSYAGTIASAVAGGPISMSGVTSGTMSFSGAVSSTGGGVSITTNGATVAFTGGLSLSTTVNPAFTATGGGVISATQNNTTIVNTLTTTTGTALNVATTTIAAAGLTFRSITAGTAASGPANAIILNNTGTNAGLTVTGNSGAGTGGTIQKTTGASISIITGTKNLSLSFMNIQNSSAGAINGTGVNGFSLTSCSITGNAGGVNDGQTAAVILTDTTNAVSFVSDTVTGTTGANAFNAELHASAASTAAITTLTVTGGSYSNSAGNGGFLIDAKSTSKVGAAFFSGVTFNNNFSKGLQMTQNDNSILGDSVTAPLGAWGGGIPNGSITITGCTFVGNNVAAELDGGTGAAGASGSTYYRFINNGTAANPIVGIPITTPGTGSSHCLVFANGSDSGGGTYKAFISGNFLGSATQVASGKGNGMRIFMQGQQTSTVTVVNNSVLNCPIGRGIEVSELGRPTSNSGQTVLNIKLTGNTVNPMDSTGFPLYAIYVAADAQGTGTSGSNVAAEIHGNTVPATSGCDTQCSASTGMIDYETVSGATGTHTGTLFNFSGSGPSVSGEIANQNTGTAGKTCSFVNGGTLTLTATPVPTVN